MVAPLTRLAREVLAPPVLRWVGLLGLCAAYLQGGLTKLADFGGAAVEMEQLGLAPGAVFATGVIVTELAGALLVLSGRGRWLGALWLGGFTLAASFAANRYWELAAGYQRTMSANAFYEHLGLAGAFLLVAWWDLREAR